MIILCIRQFLINLHQQISSAVVMITAKIDHQTVFLFKTVKRSQIFNCEYFINRLIRTDIRYILLTPHRNSDSFRESTDICSLLPSAVNLYVSLHIHIARRFINLILRKNFFIFKSCQFFIFLPEYFTDFWDQCLEYFAVMKMFYGKFPDITFFPVLLYFI